MARLFIANRTLLHKHLGVSPSFRSRLSRFLQLCARLAGSRIVDVRTGKIVGRAFMVSWGGKLHLLGYTGPPIVPVFLPQSHLSYSRQSLGFTTHPEPEFEHL